MSRVDQLRHEFVEFIPKVLEGDVVYISVAYATAVHLCCCGCGNKVVTPFSPTDWKLTFDGENVSFYPSIGNWNFPCKSHYWIRQNCVEWSARWSSVEIDEGRARDLRTKESHYDERRRMEP